MLLGIGTGGFGVLIAQIKSLMLFSGPLEIHLFFRSFHPIFLAYPSGFTSTKSLYVQSLSRQVSRNKIEAFGFLLQEHDVLVYWTSGFQGDHMSSKHYAPVRRYHYTSDFALRLVVQT